MTPSSSAPWYVWVCGTFILTTILAGLGVLVWHGSIPGTAALGVVATIAAAVLTALGLGVAVTNAVSTAVKAANSQEPKP